MNEQQRSEFSEITSQLKAQLTDAKIGKSFPFQFYNSLGTKLEHHLTISRSDALKIASSIPIDCTELHVESDEDVTVVDDLVDVYVDVFVEVGYQLGQDANTIIPILCNIASQCGISYK